MSEISRRSMLASAAAGFTLSSTGFSAFAQSGYPERGVKLIVPYPPGGTSDVLGRLLADRLGRIWKQAVIVENKVGAGGAIGVDAVAKAQPDGYSMVLGVTGALTIAPHLRKLPYDPIKDLMPISLVGASPSLLCVANSLPVKSVSELIAYAKANPGKLTFSSAGIGTSVHIAVELLQSMAGIKLLHVPYKGATPSVQALLANQVSMTIENFPVLYPHVQAGKIRGLAVTSAKRTLAAPDIPAIAETLKGYEATTWFGLFMPSGTASSIVRKAQEDVIAVLRAPDVKARLGEIGIDVVGSTSAELTSYMQAESDRFGDLIKRANIQAE